MTLNLIALPPPTQSVTVPIASPMTAAWSNTGDELFVTLTFPTGGYGAMGLATSGMSGTIVACYAGPLLAAPVCTTYLGPPNSGKLSPAPQISQLISSSVADNVTTASFSISASAWGVTAGAAQRAIFAIGPFSNVTGPQQHNQRTNMTLNLLGTISPTVAPTPAPTAGGGGVIPVFPDFTVRYSSISTAATYSFSLVYPASGYGAIAVSPEGMNGMIVFCYQQNAADPSSAWCRTYSGYSNGIDDTTDQLATLTTSAVLQGVATTVFTVDAAAFGIVNDESQRVIFATGNVIGSVPQQHADDTKASLMVNFATGQVTPVTDVVPWGYGAVAGAVLLWTAVGGLLRKSFVGTKFAFLFQMLLFVSLLGCGAVMYYSYESQLKLTRGAPPAMRIAFGHVTAMFFGLLFLPTCKHVGLARLVGSSYERAIWLHPTIAVLLLISMTVHFSLMVQWFRNNNNVGDAFQWAPKSVDTNTLAGFVAWVAFVVLSIPAMFRFQLSYKLFKVSHYLFLVVLAGGIVHYNGLALVLAPGFALWLLDWALRFYSNKRLSPVVKTLEFIEEANVVRLEISVQQWPVKSTEGGEYVCIAVSSVSPNVPMAPGIHPFTVASTSEDGSTITLLIQPAGGWTKQLAAVASKGLPASITIQGPYGSLQTPLQRHGGVVLLSGGIGITPMMSLVQHIARNPRGFPTLTKLWFFWTTRSDEQHRLMDELLSPMFATIAKSGVEVRVEYFLTHGKPPAPLFTSHRSVQQDDEDPLLGSPLTDEAAKIQLYSPSAKASSPKPANSTELKTSHHERMNCENLLSNIVSAVDREPLLASPSAPAQGNETLGLYLCGPSHLMDAATKAASKTGRFEVHSETFSF